MHAKCRVTGVQRGRGWCSCAALCWESLHDARRARAGAGLQVIGLAALLVRLSLWLGLLSHRRRQSSDVDPSSHALPVQARPALPAAVPTRRRRGGRLPRAGADLSPIPVPTLPCGTSCQPVGADTLASLWPARTVMMPCASAHMACLCAPPVHVGACCPAQVLLNKPGQGQLLAPPSGRATIELQAVAGPAGAAPSADARQLLLEAPPHAPGPVAAQGA